MLYAERIDAMRRDCLCEAPRSYMCIAPRCVGRESMFFGDEHTRHDLNVLEIVAHELEPFKGLYLTVGGLT